MRIILIGVVTLLVLILGLGPSLPWRCENFMVIVVVDDRVLDSGRPSGGQKRFLVGDVLKLPRLLDGHHFGGRLLLEDVPLRLLKLAVEAKPLQLRHTSGNVGFPYFLVSRLKAKINIKFKDIRILV